MIQTPRWTTGIIALLLLGALLLPAGAAANGNREAAQRCQQGGYLAWTDASGNPFRNAGGCTSYVARGGVLLPAGPKIGTLTIASIMLNPDAKELDCAVRADGAGFSAGVYELAWYDDGVFSFFYEVTIDESGILPGTNTVTYGSGAPLSTQVRLLFGGVEVAASPVIECVRIPYTPG